MQMAISQSIRIPQQGLWKALCAKILAENLGYPPLLMSTFWIGVLESLAAWLPAGSADIRCQIVNSRDLEGALLPDHYK